MSRSRFQQRPPDCPSPARFRAGADGQRPVIGHAADVTARVRSATSPDVARPPSAARRSARRPPAPRSDPDAAALGIASVSRFGDRCFRTWRTQLQRSMWPLVDLGPASKPASKATGHATSRASPHPARRLSRRCPPFSAGDAGRTYLWHNDGWHMRTDVTDAVHLYTGAITVLRGGLRRCARGPPRPGQPPG